MRTNIRIESPLRRISAERAVESIKTTKQNILSLENGKADLKLHIALKISRFFELKIEDDFDCD